MLIKVCGLKESENTKSIDDLGPDMIGLNFYRKSKRYVQNYLPNESIKAIQVGVFVQEPIDNIKQIIQKYRLDYAQLHGDESINYCEEVQKITKVIKVFRVYQDFSFKVTESFQFCDLLLFDTMTVKYGGSGKQFNWEILDKYKGDTPFLLSGGIGPADAETIKQFQHPKFVGVDINSKFEDAPGLKDVEAVDIFIKALKQKA